MEPYIALNGVSFSYHRPDGEIEALSDISFTVSQGEFVSLVGPSGCGKSTILSILAGLIEAGGGTITINEDVSFGYMFQQDLLLPYNTIWKNISLGPAIHKTMNASTKKRLEELLYKYGLSQFRDKYPGQLSGGMRQRAALIRTLALDPDTLLLDEPFSALDYQTRLLVADDIGKIIRRENKTAILVTHDLSEAISLSDKIIVLSARPARVIKVMDIHIPCKEKGSLAVREHPKFGEYFQILWKEMNPPDERTA
ncbi:MAG: ABC transporter ATP-binding protein [Lachnospiraceae bacterium]|nr:ABC transporter ATP-binding protein [Lachnospiraceae bacterium]